VHGAAILIYCADYRCGHSIAISSDHWPDDLRLSDIEPGFGQNRLRAPESGRMAELISAFTSFHGARSQTARSEGWPE
jgi:hypothetical protein